MIPALYQPPQIKKNSSGDGYHICTPHLASWVLKDPKPSYLITGLGDNAVNLEVRVWINDPQNDIASVKSDLFRGILQRFREHGIEMLYPQWDVHLKSVPEITIRNGPEKV